MENFVSENNGRRLLFVKTLECALCKIHVA